MKYYSEYRTKWGFNDGESIPPDAEACWIENQRILNAFLEYRGSAVRCICWFRSGVHNPYLLLLVKREVFETLPEVNRLGEDCSQLPELQDDWSGEAGDDAYDQAIQDATEYFERHGAVTVTVDLDMEELDYACEKIRKDGSYE